MSRPIKNLRRLEKSFRLIKINFVLSEMEVVFLVTGSNDLDELRGSRNFNTFTMVLMFLLPMKIIAIKHWFIRTEGAFFMHHKVRLSSPWNTLLILQLKF